MIRPFLNAYPSFDGSNYIAPSADVIGDVTLGSGASIWFNCTVRGDVNWIRIGRESNIQDNTVVHVTNRTGPTSIGDRVSIGHGAVVHGCTIKDDILIGMGAVILDNAEIGSNSIIGARALVTQNVRIPPRSLVLGSPAKVIRELTDAEITSIQTFSQNYVKYSAIYRGEEVPERNPFYSRE